MTLPKPTNGRVSLLRDPELVSLIEGTDSRADGDEAPWWEAYGGQRDPVSGLIAFPPDSQLPHCPFECELCDRRDRRRGA
ncbi:hypothetical protein BJ996_007660 [Streptomyces phaeogriseichromatogenes]|nr:hypothetical protein [Streptomyces murinus]